MTTLRNIATLLFPAAICAMVGSCDDGHINDPVRATDAETFTVKIAGNFTGQDTWTGRTSVAAACFNEESPYSLTQAPLPASMDDNEQTVTLTNVPTDTKTIEIAVVNSLRERIATIYSYSIPADQSTDDTIRLDIGSLDVGMYQTINQVVFQGNSCSRCHGGASPAANLDLTPQQAYASLVNVKAEKDPQQTRILPGNAEGSYLYKVITEGDANVSYSHPALFTNEAYSNFLNIIRDWINNGAKK